MKTKLNEPWIPIERIDAFVQLEPALVILGLSVGGWLVYRFFLKELSEERHKLLKGLFSNLTIHLTLLALLFGAYVSLREAAATEDVLLRVCSYVGLLTLFSGATVFVKTWRILVFEYLFIGHMQAAVPVLLVNLFTLLLSIFLGGWIITDIFNIQLAPLLATSAIFSVVLGLALQETLGHLFAGVSLQFDKPYEIGDWIEVQVSPAGQKWVGQVHEITWRATLLIGLADELVTIPNRIIAQAQISNFSLKTRPICRSHQFKIPYGASQKMVREILLQVAASVPSVQKTPKPMVLVSESAENWLSFKLIYSIDDYGSQWVIGDQIVSQAVDRLQNAGIEIAAPRLWVKELEKETVAS